MIDRPTYIYSLSDPRCPDNIRYIGKTTMNFDKRLKYHIEDSKKLGTHKRYWIQSLLKQNINPIIEQIDIVPNKEWQFWEIHYISLLKHWGFNLTNSTDGGDGNNNQIYTKETRKKLSIRFTGDKNPFYGKKHSEETKKMLKHKRQFQNNVNFSELLKCNKERRRPVLQYEKDGTFIKEWKSIGEAEKAYESRASISKCCNGGTKTSQGFIWKFKK